MIGQQTQRRLSPDAGIAIGPILFIVAILAILAAAIAAGSGNFTSSTSNESNRTKASALIQIGENLKVGMDRITMEGGLASTDVDINASNTSASNALFSPAGGGVSVPSVAMANTPASDVWYYVQGPVKGFGTTANETFAVLRVSSGVCSEVNNRSTGTALLPDTAALGNFASGATTSGETIDAWPTALTGVTTGCVNNSSTPAGYYYYQILAIQ